MIRINKNIALFSGIIFLVGLAFLILLEKLPPLLSHATYYCQSTVLPLLTPIPSLLLTLPFIIMAGLVLFAAIKLAVIAIQIHMLKKGLMHNVHADKKFDSLLKTLQLENQTVLIKSSKPFAFCLGLMQPKIFISTALLKIASKNELEAVLFHEQYHLKNKDTLTMVIAWFSKSLFPFLPIVSDFLNNYRVERELKADEAAITKTGTKDHLVSVLKKFLSSPTPPIAFSSAIFEYDTFEPRIKALVNDKRSPSMRLSLGSLAISFVFLFFITFSLVGPVHAMHIHEGDTHIIMLHATEDSCLDWGSDLTIHP